MTIVRESPVRTWDGADWNLSPAHSRLPRPVPTPFTGQNPPYTINFVPAWVECKTHNLKAKLVRTIESFLLPSETLWADSTHDDTATLNACLFRVRALAANAFQLAGRDLVVSLTRTYKCDQPIVLNTLTPLTSVELTGPGGTTRTYIKANGERGYIGSDRDQPQWQFSVCKRFKLTSFKIEGWRVKSADGGKDNDYEAQHGIVFFGCDDYEVRGMTVQHVMGDHIAKLPTLPPRIPCTNSRVYNNRFVNSGRLICSPQALGLDFYGNYCERNAASILDIETPSGTSVCGDIVFRNNRFHNCNGNLLHIPSYAWTERYCTATNGSATLTSPGDSPSSRFSSGDTGRIITNGNAANKQPPGDGIPPNTTVTFVSDTQATMSNLASGVTQALGYRRIYILAGASIAGLTITGNVRTNPDTTNPGECSFDAGGGTFLDGTHSFTDFVFTDNHWDRANRGGFFWNLNGCDRATISGNTGPWRWNRSFNSVVTLSQVTRPDGTPLTNSYVDAQNPGIFEQPVI